MWLNFFWYSRDGYLGAVFICFSMLLLCPAYCFLSCYLFVDFSPNFFCAQVDSTVFPHTLHFAFVSYRRPKIWKHNLRSVKLISKTVENQMNWIFFHLAISVPNCMLHYCLFSGCFASCSSFFLKDGMSYTFMLFSPMMWHMWICFWLYWIFVYVDVYHHLFGSRSLLA